MGVAARRPRLEAGLVDQPVRFFCHHRRRIGIRRGGGEQALLALQYPARPAQASRRQLRGQPAAARGFGVVHGLGRHRLVAHLPQATGTAAGSAQRIGKLSGIQSGHRAGRGGGPEGTSGGGGVPVAVVPTTERATDADGGFVAAHHRIEHVQAIGTGGLGGGQRHRDHHRARMQDRLAVHVVHFQHVAQGRVHQQGIGHGAAAGGQRHRRARALRADHLPQLRGQRVTQCRQRTAQPVHQQARRPLPRAPVDGLQQALRKPFAQAGGGGVHRGGATSSRLRGTTCQGGFAGARSTARRFQLNPTLSGHII